MDKYTEVNKILADTTSVKADRIVNQTIKVKEFSFLRLRDELYKLGKIHVELLDEQTYVAVFKGGFFNLNRAVIAFNLKCDEVVIAAYADEGLIKQHTCEGVINEFKRNIKQFIRE